MTMSGCWAAEERLRSVAGLNEELCMVAAIRIAGQRLGRMVNCSLAASLPSAKRCSDAAL